ncbi:DegT/DnrJ/EryC1/StrS aminotransferase family protein [Candidatus Albibeggiatoa sp. nov. NOAA]|uniref:DegT/DnrJ/EryC1/StrS family aminotransferase n=1 Tax=Candidatus Albibeggiatoa sp. nov. NOAA TaxID=3162724 RepID=UPI0032F44300|nr:DegT/DnrJ/EryC1/StrS aminotransferase family protein [Thiotrichaceae bacterium]
MSDDFLPFAKPCIGEEEINEVVDTLRSGWLTSGPKTKQFEQAFVDYFQVPYALAVNSCTAGLHLALEAIGIQAGDKIVTTPYTFTATAEVMHYLGADPIFVDIDRQTFNMDVNQLEAILKTEPNIKAIIPVHFAGQACDMDVILDLARQYDLKVIEDAAHALPTTYKNRKVGTLGDITVYSFYVTKPVATGEGGMIVTSNPEYAERISTMRLHGINRDIFNRSQSTQPSWYYEVVAPGFKYNMSDIMAAIGLHQFAKKELFAQQREAIAQQYAHGLIGLPLKTPELQYPCDSQHAWHLYVLQLDLENLSIDRNQFIEHMAQQGVGTSVHFIPLHLQPYWQQSYQFKPQDFPVALDVYQRAVSLPIYPSMTEADVEKVIAAVKTVLKAAQK